MKTMRRNCIFTSAGRHNNISQWLSEEGRSWDLITVYYGDDADMHHQLAEKSDIFLARKGSKFQNIHSFFQKNSECFQGYDYVWVMDDDLRISPIDIEKTFDIALRYDFWVCQPSFDVTGKISHAVTKHNSSTDVRIVDFVEVTCPLFRTDKLVQFLNKYDGSLVGWGIDYWYSHVLQSKDFYKFGIIDTVKILNPHDEVKGGIREIDILQPTQERAAHSARVLSRLGISTFAPSCMLNVCTNKKTAKFSKYGWKRLSKFLSNLTFK